MASAGERLLVALGVVVLAALVAAAVLLPAPSQRQYPSLRSLSASVASAASEVLGGAWEALPNATEMFALNYANLSAEVTFLNGTTSASRVTSVNVTILLPVGPANITLPPAGYVITLENPSARAQIVVVLFVYPNSTEPYRILDMFASSFRASPNETSGLTYVIGYKYSVASLIGASGRCLVVVYGLYPAPASSYVAFAQRVAGLVGKS